MSSLKNGATDKRSATDLVANKVGKIQFGKWKRYPIIGGEDLWEKIEIRDGRYIIDSYILIRRVDRGPTENDYYIWFSGNCYFLRGYLKMFHPEYYDHDTVFYFVSIQAAKDYIDNFLDRLDRLMVFT